MADKSGQDKKQQDIDKDYQSDLAKVGQYRKQYENMVSDDATLFRQSKILKELRMKDLEEGKADAEKIFTPGIMGRLDDTKGDVKSIFDARRANMSGYSPQEQQAMREENVGELNRQNLSAQRDLQRSQGRNRVYGATAAAQQQAQQRGFQGSLADQERKLFLDNIAAKRQGLGDFEKSTIDKEQYNIGQKNKELQGKLNTQLGYAGLGTTERGAVMGQILGDKQLKANMEANSGGKK